jgi:hypothetical protein
MANNRTRDKHAKIKDRAWREGAAYELTDEEKHRALVARLVWEKKRAMKKGLEWVQGETDQDAGARGWQERTANQEPLDGAPDPIMGKLG